MSSLLIPRREIWTQQPQGPTSTQEIFGYQVGEVVCPTVALHKISGGIGVAARASGLAFIGDSVDNCASRSLTRPFVLGKDTELTFVCVFRRQGTAQTSTTIAGMGASSGGPGDTLFRITGGDSAVDLKFQVQDGNGGIFYNINSSGVAVNDLGTHTAVIALSLSVGTGTLEFVIDGKPVGSATIQGGSPAATTFNSITACASIRGGAVVGASDADVSLAYPIFGKVSQAQAISLSLNPWQIFAPQTRNLFVPVSSIGGSYTLTTQAGSYSLTGQTAQLLKSKLLISSGGTYQQIGATASLHHSRQLSLSGGSYSISGTSAAITFTGLSANYTLTAQGGIYSLAGSSTDIIYTALSPSYLLIAQGGTYNLSGNSIDLRKSKRLTASGGVYSYIGQQIHITAGPAVVNTLVKYINVLTGEILLLQPF